MFGTSINRESMTPQPKRKLVVEFTKMSGAGNDFLVIDNRFYHFSPDELARLARKYCARRTGVGADGLLALHAPDDPGHHFRMRYLNADGSVGSMCGNGARCLARYAFEAGMDEDPLRFLTDAGPYSALVREESVRLMIPSYRDFAEVPADESGSGRHYIWTGTEHLVVFCPEVDEVDVERDGLRLRHSRAGGANVNFVEVADGMLRVRTFEKGVEGETLACGTGATAAAAVARLTDRLSRSEIQVQMRGGVLRVGFDHAGNAEYLEGPAETVFRGTLKI
jgi:diaminopimelate epimerase